MKKILQAILSMVMVLTLMACQNQKETVEKTPEETVETKEPEVKKRQLLYLL